MLAHAEGPSRLAALRRGLADARLDALIVTDPVGVHYLTGFARDAFAMLLVAGDWSVLVTVEGYAAEAEQVADALQRELVPFGVLGRVHELLRARLAGDTRIGFQSEHVTHAVFTQLAARLPGAQSELVAADDTLATLRAVKSPAEIALLRAAARPLGELFAWLCEQRLAGVGERELAWKIERRLRERHGAEGIAFETVVGGGPHGAIPHHTASDTPIAPGELLVIDVGCVIDGYRSDMTRTLAIGPPGELATEVHGLVRRAHRAALHRLAAGAGAESVHETAAAVIAAGGYGDRFLHGVGHGIGLELHELPFCEPGATGELAAGQVLTIEPGVYLPGHLGVRIEDEVVITEQGHELLTFFTPELVVCG